MVTFKTKFLLFFIILLLSITCPLTVIGASWTQIGSDIDGETAGDLSGRSISLRADGSIIAIGADGNDDNGFLSGHLRLFQNVSGIWTQIGSDIDGEAERDQLGHSVSLNADGSIVAVGAYYNDGNGENSGHARVFQNVSGNWTQIGSDIDGEAAYNISGYSVSLSADGSTLAVGAPSNGDNGHVRVFKNVSGTWTQIGSDIDGEAAHDSSGHSVSLSADGSIVAIGAPYNGGNGPDSGHVRVFKNVSGTWTQIGSDIDGEVADNYLGYSVSLSSDGSIIAIGAAGNNAGAGLVKVLKNVSGTWTQIASNIDGEAAYDASGVSVSLSADGSIVAIGAITNDGNGSDAGHVRVFGPNSYPVFTGTPTISGTAKIGKSLVLIDSGTSDADGDSVTLSYQWKADGTDISGATSSTYTLTNAEEGKSITCTITADDGTGGTVEFTTTATVQVMSSFPWLDFIPGLVSPNKLIR